MLLDGSNYQGQVKGDGIKLPLIIRAVHNQFYINAFAFSCKRIYNVFQVDIVEGAISREIGGFDMNFKRFAAVVLWAETNFRVFVCLSRNLPCCAACNFWRAPG